MSLVDRAHHSQCLILSAKAPSGMAFFRKLSMDFSNAARCGKHCTPVTTQSSVSILRQLTVLTFGVCWISILPYIYIWKKHQTFINIPHWSVQFACYCYFYRKWMKTHITTHPNTAVSASNVTKLGIKSLLWLLSLAKCSGCIEI